MLQDKEAVAHLLGIIDKANGYVFASLVTGKSPYPPEFVYGSTVKGNEADLWSIMEERYIQGKEGGSQGAALPSVSEHQPHASTTTGAQQAAPGHAHGQVKQGQTGSAAGIAGRSGSTSGQIRGSSLGDDKG
jgi:hypothetical protein